VRETATTRTEETTAPPRVSQNDRPAPAELLQHFKTVKPRELRSRSTGKFTWIEALAAVAILMILASLSIAGSFISQEKKEAALKQC